MSTGQTDTGCGSSETARARLEELIPIAVVIAAGCENCAERMIERALSQGSPRPLIGRTLRIVEYLRWRECLVKAVGPDVIARMEKALEAAKKVFRKPRGRPGNEQNCID